jgi:hypothetical protein
MSELERQIGGNHYMRYKVQPIEMFAALNWNYFQSSIAKYILRYKYKNGKEDLEKALHVAHLALELNVQSQGELNEKYIITFAKKNNINKTITALLQAIDNDEYNTIITYLQAIIKAIK